MPTTINCRLKYARRADGWWITGLPDPTAPEAGPYDSKREAQEDSDGMRRVIASAAYQRELVNQQAAQPAGTARREDKNSSRHPPTNPPRLRRFSNS